MRGVGLLVGRVLRVVLSYWRRNRLLSAAFVLALVVTAFFAGRLLVSYVYWSDPAHRQPVIEGWMTPRYVAHAYELPPEVVRSALGLEPGAGRRRTLAEIAEDSGQSLDALRRRIEEAARAHHGQQP